MPDPMSPDPERDVPESYSAIEVRRILAVLWRSELPIALVMEASRKLGDEMTVRDVFLLAQRNDDPLATWIEYMTEDIEGLAAPTEEERQHET